MEMAMVPIFEVKAAASDLPRAGDWGSRMGGAEILLADDDANFVRSLRLFLANEGYTVRVARDGHETLAEIRARPPDLLVLDLMLLGVDGWEVCRRLRERSDLPVILVSGRSEEEDKLRGFALGADDYVTKPFNPRELAARVRVVLRRCAVGRVAQEDRVLRLGTVEIDPDRYEVRVEGREARLRLKEFQLLVALAQQPGVVLSHDQLLHGVWGEDFFGDGHTLGVHVTWLRQKLAGSAIEIQSVRGVGYKLVVGEGTS
jgi:DNA-binding response OmpR family regulator